MSATTIPLAPAGESSTNALATPASRASWTGQIAIGKLVVPVKAYAAVVTASASSLHQVHARCGQSIQYRKTCPKHGEVTGEEIAKAYTYAPDDQVILSAEELATLEPAEKHTVRIEQVVAAREIPWELLSGRTLFLIPANPVAAAAYALLTRVFSTADCWGVGSGAISERPQPLGVHVVDERLVLHVFHWPAQRRSCPHFELPTASPSASETRALEQTLAALTKPLELSQFTDEYEVRLTALVQRKVSRRGTANGSVGSTKRSKLKRVALAALKRARAA